MDTHFVCQLELTSYQNLMSCVFMIMPSFSEETIKILILKIIDGDLTHFSHSQDTGALISPWMLSLVKRQVFLAVGTASLLIMRWRIMGSSTPIFHLNDNPHSFVEGTVMRVSQFRIFHEIVN